MRSTMRCGVLACVTVAACSAPATRPLPVTPDRAVGDASGTTLVSYLAQPDANPSVCDPQAAGAHVSRASRELRVALLDGLDRGTIRPDVWRACVATLIHGLPAGQAIPLLDGVLTRYLAYAKDDDLDTDPRAVERMTALHRVYAERDPAIDATPVHVAAAVSELREMLHRPGGITRSGAVMAKDLIDMVDLQRGLWQGARVDVAMLDTLATAGNEVTLRRFQRRLPSAELREAAMRRIVRIHVALSPFAEVRDAGKAVEDTVLTAGINAVQLASHRVTKLWFEPSATARRGVVVHQDVWAQRSTLLGSSPDRRALSVVATLPLHGVLFAELADISHPVTTCASPSELDPSPCIADADLASTSKLVRVDRGTLVVTDEALSIADVMQLAGQPTFELGVSAGGTTASVTWPLQFAAPDRLVLAGDAPAGRGPDLLVRIGAPAKDRFSFDVNVMGRDYIAIVEARDLPAFEIATVGGEGAHGSSGTSGSTGSSGSQCSDGGRGGDGGNGSPGGAGGRGGDIAIHLDCSGSTCTEIQHGVRPVIRSLGGPGGAGGSGGSGGSGGAGGSARMATTHVDADGHLVTDDQGCSAGATGSSGTDGSSGATGPSGEPGLVRW